MRDLLSVATRNRIRSALSMTSHFGSELEQRARATADRGLLDLLSRIPDPDPQLRGFFDFCVKHSRYSFSQMQQDLFALWATNVKRDGFFIEFGAADGITHSNSLMLERYFGWHGVLIEPLPWHKKELLRKRRDSIVISGAVDPYYSGSTSTDLIVAGQLSSIPGFHDRDQHADYRRRSSTRVRVELLNLNDILDKHAPDRRVDFMSIDVEGPEKDILSGLDTERFYIRLICAEVNDRIKDREAVTILMRQKGFRAIFDPSVTRNDIWFSNELERDGL